MFSKKFLFVLAAMIQMSAASAGEISRCYFAVANAEGAYQGPAYAFSEELGHNGLGTTIKGFSISFQKADASTVIDLWINAEGYSEKFKFHPKSGLEVKIPNSEYRVIVECKEVSDRQLLLEVYNRR